MHAITAAEKFVDVNGTRVRYLDGGNSGTDRPLLLLHGVGQSSTSWQRAIDRLTRSRRVIAPDMPGFGGSDIPLEARYDPAYFSHFIGEFARALSLERADAAGHSGGALVLMLDALEHPQRYGRLVLVDPAGFTHVPDNALGTAAVSLVKLLVSLPRNRALTRALYATAFCDPSTLDDATVDELVRRRGDRHAKLASKRAFLSFFAFCQKLAPFHGRLAALAMPVLVIWGSDDHLLRASDAVVAERVLRHARIERFERCGHCPHIERPDRFADVVQEFLSTT